MTGRLAPARVYESVRGRIPRSTRRRILNVRHAVRQPTAGARMVPDFLVIGTMRGGTSSLFKYLAAHPQIGRPLRKEIEFFSWDWDRGLDWYRAHFPLRARSLATRGGLQTFESTPYYLLHPHAPGRAASTVPEARIVALLRNPVDRAYSHHQHMTRLGFEDLPFAEAVAREADRVGGDFARMEADPAYHSKDHHRFTYVERGRYAEQLDRWLRHFPRERILVVRSEDFYQRPSEVLGEILSFLGLEARWRPREFRNYSYGQGGTGRYDDMDRALRAELEETFSESVAELEAMLNRRFGWFD